MHQHRSTKITSKNDTGDVTPVGDWDPHLSGQDQQTNSNPIKVRVNQVKYTCIVDV